MADSPPISDRLHSPPIYTRPQPNSPMQSQSQSQSFNFHTPLQLIIVRTLSRPSELVELTTGSARRVCSLRLLPSTCCARPSPDTPSSRAICYPPVHPRVPQPHASTTAAASAVLPALWPRRPPSVCGRTISSQWTRLLPILHRLLWLVLLHSRIEVDRHARVAAAH